VATSGSFQAVSDGGLLSAAVAVVAQPGTSGITFTGATPNWSSGPPTGYQGGLSLAGLAAGNAGAWIADQLAYNSTPNGVQPASTATDGNGTTTSLYFLGTVTIAVDVYAGGTLKIESPLNAPTVQGFYDAGTDGNTLTFNNGYQLDGNGNGGPLPPGETVADMGDAHPTAFGTFLVPELASLAVFGLGGIGLLSRRRRRRS
jgi:hypothetical protein